MTRRWLLAGGATLPLLLLAVAPSGAAPASPARAAPAPMVSRAFTLQAEAFPVDPGFDVNQQSVSVRPASVRLSVFNPPATAHGYAAALDQGFAEAYTAAYAGPPPPGSVAECDSGLAGAGRRAAGGYGPVQLQATCDPAPRAQATATAAEVPGVGAGVRSSASADASAGLVASAHVEVTSLDVGQLHVDALRFDGEVRTDGTPGGARAEGRVTATGARVGDVPVTIDGDGVSVDRQRVPLDFAGPARQAVSDGLARSGIVSARLVQPTTTVAADGSDAEVGGGGLFVRFDGARPYFPRVTLAGGALRAAVGQELSPARTPIGGGSAASVLPDRTSNLPGAPASGRPAGGPAAAGFPGPPAGVSAAPVPARFEISSATVRRSLPGRSSWWLVTLLSGLGGAALVGALAPLPAVRRRARARWDELADRFVRG